MVALRHQSQSKATYQRGQVICRKCAAPIYIYKVAALPEEFSVRCQRCGDRGMFRNREIVIETLPERRKKPRPEQRR